MTKNTNLQGRSVYVVDGSRTPFLKASGKIGPFSASDLACETSRQLLARQPFGVDEIDEVIVGNVMPSPDEANIARIIALRLGCKNTVPAWTVHRNCASGMQALDNAAQNIASGRANLILAGGCEAMSAAPVLFNHKMVNWLGAWMGAKGIVKKLKTLVKFRLSFLVPVIALLRGLRDPIIGLNMGQTAEELAYLHEINREEMDQFALRSHQLLTAAEDNNLSEITSIIDKHGQVYQNDNGVRADSSLKKLAKLKPFFDKKFGSVTAANSSQVTDGACMLLLASEEIVKKYNLSVLGKIIDVEWAGLKPSQMGLGPIHAMTPILKRHNFKISDIDYWEINEAFAAQVLACLKAWQNDDYCRENLELDSSMGEIPLDKLNVDGGAIACGHPIGASGARIVLHLLKTLQQTNTAQGMASICIGGGQGGAMLLERVEGNL